MRDTPGLFGGRGFCPTLFHWFRRPVPSPQLPRSLWSPRVVCSWPHPGVQSGLGRGSWNRWPSLIPLLSLSPPSPLSPPYNSCSRPGVGWGGLGEGARIRGMDQPMKGAGEQKGGGWEEEGEGVRANRLWRPHKDWPRTEGEDREVGGNRGGGRGDPLLTCPRDRSPLAASAQVLEPQLSLAGPIAPHGRFSRYPSHSLPSAGMALLLLSPPGPLPLKSWKRLLPTPTPQADTAPHPHAHAPSPRGSRSRAVSPSGPPVALPARAAAPDCPNAILESLAPAES